jgi:Na+:H+ antiporter, NhaA family
MTSAGRAALAVRLTQPFRQFAQWQAGGAVVLLVATCVAMALANSAWHATVERFWETPLSVGFGGTAFSLSLRAWISDGLMALFFLLVGLEIKRELLVGELSTMRTAALPLIAALGGMVVPAMIFWSVNRGTDGVVGWGIPTATDIAFAIGVLALLGSRIPPALTVFLVALAIADDLGAVVVISVFYGHAPDPNALIAAGALIALLVLANASGVAWTSVYVALGIVLWYFVFRSGIHPTVAGVLLAMTIPARSRIEPEHFVRETRERLQDFVAATENDGRAVLSNDGQQRAIAAIEGASEDAQPPLVRLLHALHTPVNFFIMPLFALANAGVVFGGSVGTSVLSGVSLGVFLGLVLGKPLGILAATWVATRFGVSLPNGVSWACITGAACLAGIGFTMSLFVAGLAFSDASMLAQAKLGIVGASLAAGLIGTLVLRWATRSGTIVTPASR